MPDRAENRSHTFQSIGGLLREIAARFEAAGIDNSRLDARVLIAHALELEPSRLFTMSNDVVEAVAINKIEALVERRLAREPVSRIIGRREFWGLEFLLAPETLDPRPDTETLVSAVLDFKQMLGDRPVRILDLGTGTGCILLAVLSEWPMAVGLGIDIDDRAVATAKTNAERLELSPRATFAQGNWTDGLDGMFDIVVSNPPYVAESEKRVLPAEVAKYDPFRALFGGVDGLDAYRSLLPLVRRVLEPKGHLVIEIGAGQADAVTNLLSSAGFKLNAQKEDLSKIVRCLVACPV